MYTSRQNLPSWFDNDDFHCYHSGEVVETYIDLMITDIAMILTAENFCHQYEPAEVLHKC